MDKFWLSNLSFFNSSNSFLPVVIWNMVLSSPWITWLLVFSGSNKDLKLSLIVSIISVLLFTFKKLQLLFIWSLVLH